jgi:cellulose synthase/poly-beta-1,6-N-acetylglucosamine synthase-like glycosyltransferase
MEILVNIVMLIDMIILIYLGLSAVYFLFFAILSLFYKEKQVPIPENKIHVCILIPSYKEDSVIIDTAISAVAHKSVRATISVIVIADSLQDQTIVKIRHTNAFVLPVRFEKSTKSKSVRAAIDSLDYSPDYIIILDADNIMNEGFVDNLLKRIDVGYKIVQGHRVAKNSNTRFAILDGVSEEVNNSIFRKGHSVSGLSASIIGSGFICEFNLFKELIQNAKSVGGFDKELELMLIERKIKIGYAQHAIVFDEKIQQAEAFVNQRRRWLSAQFVYFGKNFFKGFYLLFVKGNIDYVDKLIQFLVLPRILTLGLTGLLAAIHLILNLFIENSGFYLFMIYWCLAFVVTAIAIWLAIPLYQYNKNTLNALWSLPSGFFLTLIALFRVKGANKKFIHTKHGIN